MKFTYETKYDIGQVVYYVASDNKASTYTCVTCGTKCTNHNPALKVYKDEIIDIALWGKTRYEHDILLTKDTQVSYVLASGYEIGNDKQIYLTEEEAVQHLTDPDAKVY